MMKEEHDLGEAIWRGQGPRRVTQLPLTCLAAPRKVLLRRALAHWQECETTLDDAGWDALCRELRALGRARRWQVGEPIAGYIAPIAIRFSPLQSSVAALPSWDSAIAVDRVEAWAGAGLDTLAATVHQSGGGAQLDRVELQLDTARETLVAQFDRLLLPYRLPNEEIGLAVLSQMRELHPADQLLSRAL